MFVRNLRLSALLLTVLYCSQVRAAQIYEYAAPEPIKIRCATFHQIEARPDIQTALQIVRQDPSRSEWSLYTYGTELCAFGPPKDDETSVQDRAFWLDDLNAKLSALGINPL